MVEKNHGQYITIGKLSKITGIHIQSLRYYERIGALIPAYVDASSNYRYYSFSQIKVAEAIQYCVELGIPLKSFHTYLSEDKNQIDYEKLLSQGRELAEKKLQAIREKMQFFEAIGADMHHGEACEMDASLKCHLPSKTYLLTLYRGTQENSAFHTAIIDLLAQVRANGWQTSYDSGMLSRYTKNGAEHFAYVDVLQFDPSLAEDAKILTLPALAYSCKRVGRSDIHAAPTIFVEEFEVAGDKIVIERELFTRKFAYAMPCYELRCASVDLA